MIEITQIRCSDGVLRIVCAGDYGAVSAGNESAAMLASSIKERLGSPSEEVHTLEIDYSGVAYSWGGGPVSSVVPFLKRFKVIRLIAGPANEDPLRRLIHDSGLAECVTVVSAGNAQPAPD